MIHLESAIQILQMATRNILRQRARTAVTAGAIAFGVAGLMMSGGFVADLYFQLREALIHSQTGHLQLARIGYLEAGSRSPEKFIIDAPRALLAELRDDSRIVDAMQRFNFSGLLGNGRTEFPIIGQGIEPDKEARLGSSLVVRTGRVIADKDAFGMMVGSGLAAALQLKLGDQVNLVASMIDGAMNTQEFEVVGVFDSYSRDYDARAVRIPLAAARELLGSAGANLIVVSLKATEDTAAVADRLRPLLASHRLEVQTWDKLSDFYVKAVTMYERQFGVLRLIVLVMVLLGVANSVNMSLFERVGEFATMRALGNHSYDLYRLIAAEALVLAGAGVLIGLLAGLCLAGVISWIGIPMPPPPHSELGYTARIQLLHRDVLEALAVGFVATLLAFVPATLRIARVSVIDGLRQNA